jgi:hypothetical protein
MNIKEILNKINNIPNDTIVKVNNKNYITGNFGSYRGNYKELYLEDDTENNNSNIGLLKSTLNNALNKGSMSGYKGGLYKINYDTSVVIGFREWAYAMIDIEINDICNIITSENI